MTATNATWIDDARGTLETLVNFLDEIDESDLQDLPDDIASLLNYVNLKCRELVKRANGE